MRLPETVTLAAVPGLIGEAQATVAAGTGPLAVDASALASFDTSAIALLMHTRRLAQAAGREMSVVGAPAKLAELARLYGVESLLGLSAGEGRGT
jgi:phospholipid transport system transporter-binding protein